MYDGILLLDKVTGPTSHDLIDQIRKISGQKRVGHTGTLDPRASGLLIVLLGRATRLSSWMKDQGKSYQGIVRFGVSTDTFDGGGRVTAKSPCDFRADQLAAATEALTGDLVQRTPIFSAAKVGGRPAHKFARAGEPVELKKRSVKISEFHTELADEGDFPSARFSISCSSGTYIRQIAVDIGEILGCPAHLEELRRTAVGPFMIGDAVRVDALQEIGDEELAKKIRPMRDGLQLPEVFISSDELDSLLTGRRVRIASAGDSVPGEGDVASIIDRTEERLVGLGKIDIEQSGPSGRSIYCKPFLVLA